MRQFGPTPIRTTLAACGSPHCNGCYDVGDGRKIHPPKPGALYLKGKAVIPSLSVVPRRKKKKKNIDDDSQEGLLSFT